MRSGLLELKSVRMTRTMRDQLLKYILVGGSTALAELLVFAFLIRLWGLPLIPANIIAVIVATGLNFSLNRSWAFNSQIKLMRSMILYLTLFGFNLAFSSVAIDFLVKLGILDVIAKALTMGLITIWNFILYRKVIFGRE